MAILRGGRRIGNYDIRLGIPRDRSLDNVEGDRRLKRVQGPTPESTIGRVMGAISQGEGFARPNRFMVDFILPSGVFSTSSPNESEFDDSILFEEEVRRSTRAGELNSNTEVQRGLRAFVESVDMPGRTLDTTDFTTAVTSNTNGTALLSLTNSQTNALKVGRYVYDVELSFVDSSGATIVERILEGRMQVTPSVTK